MSIRIFIKKWKKWIISKLLKNELTGSLFSPFFAKRSFTSTYVALYTNVAIWKCLFDTSEF